MLSQRFLRQTLVSTSAFQLASKSSLELFSNSARKDEREATNIPTMHNRSNLDEVPRPLGVDIFSEIAEQAKDQFIPLPPHTKPAAAIKKIHVVHPASQDGHNNCHEDDIGTDWETDERSSLLSIENLAGQLLDPMYVLDSNDLPMFNINLIRNDFRGPRSLSYGQERLGVDLQHPISIEQLLQLIEEHGLRLTPSHLSLAFKGLNRLLVKDASNDDSTSMSTNNMSNNLSISHLSKSYVPRKYQLIDSKQIVDLLHLPSFLRLCTLTFCNLKYMTALQVLEVLKPLIRMQISSDCLLMLSIMQVLRYKAHELDCSTLLHVDYFIRTVQRKAKKKQHFVEVITTVAVLIEERVRQNKIDFSDLKQLIDYLFICRFHGCDGFNINPVLQAIQQLQHSQQFTVERANDIRTLLLAFTEDAYYLDSKLVTNLLQFCNKLINMSKRRSDS